MSFIGFEMEITASVTLLYFNNISVAAFAQIKESFRKVRWPFFALIQLPTYLRLTCLLNRLIK